jgi:hypothetical protein
VRYDTGCSYLKAKLKFFIYVIKKLYIIMKVQNMISVLMMPTGRPGFDSVAACEVLYNSSESSASLYIAIRISGS